MADLQDPQDQDYQTRHQNELALLQSMYPDEFTLTSSSSCSSTDFQIRLDPLHTLLFTLPQGYPIRSKPEVYLSFDTSIPNSQRRNRRDQLRQVIDQQDEGVECIDLIISDFREALEATESTEAAQPAETHPSDDTPVPQQGARVVLWMHHLLATSKRKAIVQLSKELGLAGFSKPGYPGAVYVEGAEDAVRAFVEELKSMRWQALQERATEAAAMDALALLFRRGAGIEEVEGLGDIAQGLQDSDPQHGPRVASLFLEGMKIK